jgi:hypothetical protein
MGVSSAPTVVIVPAKRSVTKVAPHSLLPSLKRAQRFDTNGNGGYTTQQVSKHLAFFTFCFRPFDTNWNDGVTTQQVRIFCFYLFVFD